MDAELSGGSDEEDFVPLRAFTYRAIVSDAIRAGRREMCGLLVVPESLEFLIYMPADNVAVADDEYIVDAETHLKALDNGEIVGVVHSHVNRDAAMSGMDLANAREDGMRYLIYSVRDSVMRAWKIVDAIPVEVKIVVDNW